MRQNSQCPQVLPCLLYTSFEKGDTVYAASCNHTANFLIIREQGYKAALEELCPDITVEWVAEGIGGNAANGVTAGENFLQTGKDINLVVGINDGGCLGVLEAFNAAGYGGDKAVSYTHLTPYLIAVWAYSKCR